VWSRDHGLETRVHSSSFCLGVEFWSLRSRSRDSKLCAYACSTITVICSIIKQVLSHQLELMQPVLWSQDHGLETRVHFVQVSVSRPEVQGFGLGLKTWRKGLDNNTGKDSLSHSCTVRSWSRPSAVSPQVTEGKKATSIHSFHTFGVDKWVVGCN